MEEVYRGCANITGLGDHCERQDEDTVSYLYSYVLKHNKFWHYSMWDTNAFVPRTIAIKTPNVIATLLQQ